MKTKSTATSSKLEKKKKLVELRLAMLEQELTPQPLEMIKPTSKTKGSVRRSKEQCSSSESSAMKRAEEFQANLSTEYPSFVKYMLRSHIASCFWLGLPSKFCDDHLPISDQFMDLIDESGEKTRVKYLAAKTGLSGGWRGFAIAHILEEGDVLVFQLVQCTTFEVYIIRRNALGETDGALGLLGLDTRSNLMISNDDDDDKDSYEQEKILPVASFGSPSSEGISSEVLDCVKLSETKKVNLESYEKFRILLDGSISIDAMFPDHIRRKYYELCTKQNSCLHEKLQKEKNRTLVIGIINETINISDAIKASEHSSRIPENDELLSWDRTLQSFQMLGMNVGSIRVQIHRLMERMIEHEETVVLKAKVERELAGEKMKSFEVKLLELMDHMDEIDDEIEKMEEGTKRKRMKLREMETSCSGVGPSFV